MLDLKKIRKELKKTQQEMADAVGLSQSAYSKLERGEWNASGKKEEKIETAIKLLKPSLNIDDYRNGNRVNIVYGVAGKVGRVEKFTVKAQDSPLYDVIDRQEAQIRLQEAQIQTLLEAMKTQTSLFSALLDKLK